MNFDKFKLSHDKLLGELITHGFELELKVYTNDEGDVKRFCVLTFNTSQKDFKFIMLPEELKALSNNARDLVKNIPMRKEMFPETTEKHN